MLVILNDFQNFLHNPHGGKHRRAWRQELRCRPVTPGAGEFAPAERASARRCLQPGSWRGVIPVRALLLPRWEQEIGAAKPVRDRGKIKIKINPRAGERKGKEPPATAAEGTFCWQPRVFPRSPALLTLLGSGSLSCSCPKSRPNSCPAEAHVLAAPLPCGAAAAQAPSPAPGPQRTAAARARLRSLPHGFSKASLLFANIF